MLRFFRCALLLFILLPLPGHSQSALQIDPSLLSYDQLYDDLIEQDFDQSLVASIAGLTLTKDVATFHFTEGVLYLLPLVAGQETVLFFTGEGIFEMTPPIKIEREQLQRFYKTQSLNEPFKHVFLIATDRTVAQLKKQLVFEQFDGADRHFKNNVNICLSYIKGRKTKWLHSAVARAFLQPREEGLFYAQFGRDVQEPFFFSVDPGSEEEVDFGHRADLMRFYHVRESVCRFHKLRDYGTGVNTDNEDKSLFSITHYKIESTIENDLDFAAHAELTIVPKSPDLVWLKLSLFSELEVAHIITEDSMQLEFYKEKENSTCWVKLPPSLNKIRPFKLIFSYSGELLERDMDDWIYIRSSTGWYPRRGRRNYATFDLTFHTPKRYDFLCIGENIEKKKNKDVLTTQWVIDWPMRNASFNIGDFKEHKVKDKRIPNLSVYKNKYGHSKLGAQYAVAGVVSGRNMDKDVAADVANSLALFQHVYGPLDIDRFTVTEVPYAHGEAFPGLIHLSWETFQFIDYKGYSEIFRAHEVAHQWWGIGVDFKTYRDQWLSEGLAEFSGLWYLQTVLQDNEKYFNILRKYRDAIYNNRKYLFGQGQEAGPIYLGFRNSSSKTEGDYSTIVYKKGAWVINMLRTMLLDTRSMQEDRFENMMKEFYATYRGKRASTADFKRVVDKYCGTDMSWFFNQWVYGTDLPEYEFTWESEQRPDGKYVVNARVLTKGVSDDFQMPIPFLIDFGEGRIFRLKHMVKGKVMKFQFPLMPIRPERIIFNDLESVLCKVEYK